MAVNLTPETFTEFFTGLPISWLAQGPVGQANGQALGYILDTNVLTLQQAIQARFPEFAPSDAYGAIATDRQLIQGYNDGYNVSPSLDGYLFPARLKAAWQQWQFAGTAIGLLIQLHYQGVDGYLVQQNGLAFSLNTAIASYSAYPSAQITLTCTNPGLLGAAVFSFQIENGASGTISTAAEAPYTFQLPGTQTVLYFPQQSYVLGAIYVINTQGQLSYWNGATPGITQVTSPKNALRVSILDPNPNIAPIPGQSPSCGHPAFPINLAITTGGGLGTMEFTYQYQNNPVSAPIVSQATQFEYLIPGTQTRVLFYDGSYVLNSTYIVNVDGTISNVGGIDTVRQYTTPWFSLDQNPAQWAKFLFIVNPIPSWVINGAGNQTSRGVAA